MQAKIRNRSKIQQIRVTPRLVGITENIIIIIVIIIIVIICPGYGMKLQPILECRSRRMRLPFATITSRSPLSKVQYLFAPSETIKFRVGVRRGLVCLMGGGLFRLGWQPP